MIAEDFVVNCLFKAYRAFRKVLMWAPADSELAKKAGNTIQYIQKYPDRGTYAGYYE